MAEFPQQPDNGPAGKTPRLAIPFHSPDRSGPPGFWGRVQRRTRSWARNNFSRDAVGGGLRSLLWVGPLTLLIWVYAERAQLAMTPNVRVPIEVVSSDPNFVVTLADDSKSWVNVTLSGPHAQVDAAREKVEYSGNNPPVRVEINPALGTGRQRVPATRLGDDPRFVANGVTVTNPQPEWLDVIIDPIVERNATIVAPPEFQTLRAPTFDPPAVKVRGPARVLDDLRLRNQLVAHANLANHPDLKETGESTVTLKDVRVTLPYAARNVAVAGSDTTTATVELARREEYTIDFVPVSVVIPPGGLDTLGRVQYQPTVKDLKVVGPKDQIELLKRPNAPKPEAQFKIPPDPAPGTNTAPLRYIMPGEAPDVKVDEMDRPPMVIEYTVTPRDGI